MSEKTTLFYRGNKAVSVDFNGDQISSDGSIILLEKLERKHGLLGDISRFIPDRRQPGKIRHSVEKLVKQRVFALMHGYEDANDGNRLAHDPLYTDVLGGKLASQPTVSRFENAMDKRAIFQICRAWLERYLRSLKGGEQVIIDIDATDDPTHGNQQLSLFHGYYGRYIYNELYFHDGTTGQIILPVLRPGNSHSNRWYVSILRRIVEKIQANYPRIRIIIRADSGFSCPGFYALAESYDLEFVVGMATNAVLKGKVARAERAVSRCYGQEGIKHQHFFSYEYQAGSWATPQRCYAKVESTGKGLNTRHIVSNLPEGDGRKIYWDWYVKRGEASENRIKEVKIMCYADRLSNHGYWANFMRLLLSCLAYEFFVLLREAIRKTEYQQAWNWQIQTIRIRLLKVGATLHKTKRRIYYRLSRAFVWQDLFKALIT